MINLIPQAAKRKILLEYWVRVGTIWLALVSFLLIVASVSLLPSYIQVKTQINVYSEGAEERLAEVNEYNSSVKELIEASSLAKLILDQNEYTSLISQVTLIETIADTFVRLESYELSRVSTEELKPIIITGRADTREALADFRAALLNHPAIETAILPLSNLARDRDITFSITLTLTSPKT